VAATDATYVWKSAVILTGPLESIPMNEASSDIGHYLPPGTRVRYDGWAEDEPEYGIIVHCWLNPKLAMYDCLVAFFGNEFPVGEPAEHPYVLRYSAASLVALT
jgi:hypothetical protein